MLLYLLATQSPTDFWHDPFIQFVIYIVVALIVGIATVLTTIWVFRKQRSKKEISYQIISDAPIASVNKEFQNRVMILFDGKAVGGVRQVVLKILNSGNTAVKREDYDEPISITFKGSLILGNDVLSTEPEVLIKSIDKNSLVTHDPVGSFDEETEVRIGKFLLNPKQAITLTFLLDKAFRKLEVSGRIIDGYIVEYKEDQSSRKRLYLIRIFFKPFARILSMLLFPFAAFSSSVDRIYNLLRRFPDEN